MPKTQMSWEARATIIAAVIGLIGVVITAVFGYLNARTTIEVPLNATQTAAAEGTRVALASPSATAPSVQPGATATWTLAAPSPSPTMPPAATLTTPATLAATAELLPLNLGLTDPPGCYPTGLPVSMHPAQDPGLAAQVEALSEDDKAAWAELASPTEHNGDIRLHFWLESTNKGNEWIRLGNTMNVKVSALPLPATSDAFIDVCGGGGGEIRDFPAVALHTGVDTYATHSTYSQFDFFTLKPGEVEEFRIPLHCTGPGAFAVTVEIPYLFKQNQGNVTWASPRPLVCPKRFTLWSSGDRFLKIGTYSWNGAQYAQQ